MSFETVMVIGLVGGIVAVGAMVANMIIEYGKTDNLPQTTNTQPVVDEAKLARMNYMWAIIEENQKEVEFKRLTMKRESDYNITFGITTDDELPEGPQWQQAKKEIRLFKRMIVADRKDIHDTIQQIRRGFRNERANYMPRMIGGGKWGRIIRAGQTISRHSDRQEHVTNLATYEAARDQYDNIIETLDDLRDKVEGKLLAV